MSSSYSGGDPWKQYYEQQQQTGTISDAVHVTSSSGLNCGGPPAPGRRPRVSRRAIPTTLLNANPSNFRALVQQFTGRNSVRRRGPVTLDFGSPTSTATEEIFPRGGGSDYEGYNYDNAVDHMRGDRGQRWSQRPNAGRENVYYQETASYRIRQESTAALYGQSDAQHHHEGHDLWAENYGNSNDHHHDNNDDMMMLEEVLMTDIETFLRN